MKEVVRNEMMQQNRNEQKWNDSPFRGTEMIVLSDEL